MAARTELQKAPQGRASPQKTDHFAPHRTKMRAARALVCVMKRIDRKANYGDEEEQADPDPMQLTKVNCT